jgi:hypothetical protein
VGATYEVEAKPSDPALGFGAEAEPFMNPVLTPPNKERGDDVGDGSLQSHPGVNLHPKRVKNRGNGVKGGEADGVSLTGTQREKGEDSLT